MAHDGYLQEGPVAKKYIYDNTLSKMHIKINFSLEKAIKPRGGLKVVLYSFFKLGASWGCVVNAMPQLRSPGKRPGAHWIEGWVDTRSNLDWCVRSRPHRNLIPRVVLYSFFKLGAKWRCVVNAMPQLRSPGKRPGAHWIEGWVDPRSSLDWCVRSRPHRNLIPR